MNRKLKGFSLAELLISLLVISIVLSAAIPTLTKRSGAEREQIWRWTSQGNNAYFGVGSNQSAIIGINAHPAESNSLGTLLTDPEVEEASDELPEAGDINIGDLQFSSAGDKLVILKKTVQGNNSNFMNSHISFFTLANNGAATTDDIEYAGRLTLDPGNIALGMGSLQSISEDNVGENTAIGHYALSRNTDGYRNTAVGKKTLSYNTSGSYNTALGYASLFQSGNGGTTTDENTAIGALSQVSSEGSYNTSIGSQSLARNKDGDSNTAIGTSALGRITSGSNNTALGSGACGYITSGSGNICIGYQAGPMGGAASDTNGLYIGGNDDETPLISGHTTDTDTNDKELIVNALSFELRPPNGVKPSFRFSSFAGSDGYSGTNEGQRGIAQFFLRDTGSTTGSSVELDFRGELSNSNAYTLIDSYDSYNQTDVGFFFNRRLKLSFDQVDGTQAVSINAESTDGNTNFPLVLNDVLHITESDTTPELYMDENGFNLISDIHQLEMSKDGEFNFKLGDPSSNGGIWFAQDSMTMTSPTININAQDGKIGFASNTVYMDSQDVVINGIPKNGGSVKTNINNIWTQLDQGTPSDARLKNISGDNTAGLKEINALEVKNYTYKNDENKTPHVGVIAQQLQKIFPNSVTKDDEGYLRIRTEEIFYAMVNSIKELCKQIQDLTAKITGLDKRITELEEQNKLLLEQNKAFEKRLEKLEKKNSK